MQWQKTYGYYLGDLEDQGLVYQYSNIVAATLDGGFLVTSLQPIQYLPVNCNSGNPMALTKFSRYGKVEWQVCPGTYAFGVNSVVQGLDSSYYLIGSADEGGGAGEPNAVIEKHAKNGGLLWHKTYGGTGNEEFLGSDITADGGLVVCGSASSIDGDLTGVNIEQRDGGSNAAWVARLDTAGTIQWQKCVPNGNYTLSFITVKQAPDGGYVASGYGSNVNAFKFDASGNIVWGFKWNAQSKPYRDCAVNSKNEVYLTEPGYLYKLSAAGALLWRKSFDKSKIASIRCTPNDELVVCGNTNSEQNIVNGLHFNNISTGEVFSTSDIFVSRLDTAGNIVYTKCYGGYYDEFARYIAAAKDGSFGIMGFTSSWDGDVVASTIPDAFVDTWVFKIGGYNTITGRAFYDYNNNGKQDSSEPYFTGVKVISEKGGGYNGAYLTNGPFSYTVDTGALQTSLVLNKPYFQVTPSPYPTNYQTYNNTDTVNFAVYPLPGIHDLSVSMGCSRNPRPGFFNNYHIVCTNTGTELAKKVQLAVKFDGRINIYFANPPNNKTQNDTLFWDLANLEPGAKFETDISVYLPPPPVSYVGDTLTSYIHLFSKDADTSVIDNTDTIRQVVAGAIDPNEKIENSGGGITLNKVLAGKYLTYTINFQNTGTDTAINIRVRDTLSNKLDWASLEVVSASNAYQLNITAGKNIEWVFNKIMLADSFTNEKRSHGYIIYRVKPKSNVAVNDTISNTAAIYFDYNLPVFTGTCVTVILPSPYALPLNLLQFSGAAKAGGNLLQWLAANQVNTKNFVVERSSAAIGFAPVGSVPAGVKGGAVHNYLFTDAKPLAGTGYYRLKIMDADGRFTYSKIINIYRSAAAVLYVYPNPAKTIIHVQHPAAAAAYLRLTDITGKPVRLINATRNAVETNIKINGLAPGVYQLVWSDGSQILHKTLVIE